MDTVKIETDMISEFDCDVKSTNVDIKSEIDEGLAINLTVKEELDCDNDKTVIGQENSKSNQRTPFNARDFIDTSLNDNVDRASKYLKSSVCERSGKIDNDLNESSVLEVKQEIDLTENSSSSSIIEEEIEFVHDQENGNIIDNSISNENMTWSDDEADVFSEKRFENWNFKPTIPKPRFRANSLFNKYVTNFKDKVTNHQLPSLTTRGDEVHSETLPQINHVDDADESNFNARQQRTSPSNNTNLYPLKCRSCDFSTSKRIELRIHFKKSHFENLKRYQCLECDARFKKYSCLEQHIDTVHNKNYKCRLCAYCAGSRNFLNAHLESVHSVMRRFKCEMCDYGTEKRVCLEAHVNAVHLKRKDFKCHMCDYAGSTSLYLKRHVEAMHLKRTKHKCMFCDYRSYNRDSIKYHTDIIHLSKYSFKCIECSYKSCIKSSLVAHVNNVHLKLKK